MHDNRLVTVFSASHYCGRDTNKGAFIIFEPDMSHTIQQVSIFPALARLEPCSRSACNRAVGTAAASLPRSSAINHPRPGFFFTAACPSFPLPFCLFPSACSTSPRRWPAPRPPWRRPPLPWPRTLPHRALLPQAPRAALQASRRWWCWRARIWTRAPPQRRCVWHGRARRVVMATSACPSLACWRAAAVRRAGVVCSSLCLVLALLPPSLNSVAPPSLHPCRTRRFHIACRMLAPSLSSLFACRRRTCGA